MSASVGDILDRRKQVRLRARPNLQCVSRIQGGRRVYVIKDPVALQYFHLEEPQKFTLDRMDGEHTLEQIQQEFESANRPQRLTLEELEGFASQLLQAGLVENESTSRGQLVLNRVEKQRRFRMWTNLASIFYFKMPLLQSTRCFDTLLPVGRVVFHPLFVLLTIASLLAGIGLVITRWSDFLERLPAYQDLFTLRGAFYLWLAIGAVKIVHELGHAICARILGCEVQDVGIAVTYFFPTLYCNVSDSWMLPEKGKRIAIGAAGMYAELLIASGAIWIWWASTPQTLLHQISFWLMLTCSVHTILFNANPLMRFDGYFIFSDWLDIPNLSQVAQRQFHGQLGAWFGYEAPHETATRSSTFLCLFGLASLVYRCGLVAAMLYVFHQFMKDLRLEWLGLALVLLALIVLLAWPGYRLWQTLGTQPKVSPMKPLRFWVSIGAAVVVLIGFFLVPFPIHVRGVGLVQVEPERLQSIAVPAPGGFLVQTFGKDGQRVRKGDVLAVLHNPQLSLELRLSEADLALRRDQHQALISQQAALEGAGAEWDSRTEIQQEIEALTQRHALLKTRAATLLLRAPCDGILMSFPGWESQGQWLTEGAPLFRIGDDRNVRLLVLLEPADRQLIDVGKPVRFRCHGLSDTTWHGAVASAAQVDTRDIPVQLSQRLGGDVASRADPVNKMEKPDKQQFLVAAKLTEVDGRLQVGTLGQVRIEVGSQTCWWRLQRYLGSTFRWSF